jgi:hypothetical protein
MRFFEVLSRQLITGLMSTTGVPSMASIGPMREAAALDGADNDRMKSQRIRSVG